MTADAKRRACGGAVALIVLFAFLPRFIRSAEPSHNSRPLSAWLDDLMVGRDGAQHEQARAALHSLGAGALPALLRRIAAEEPFWHPLAVKVVRATGLRGPRSDALEQREQAERAFTVLGLAAQPAIPELQKILREQPENSSAKHVLLDLEEALRARTHGPTTR